MRSTVSGTRKRLDCDNARSWPCAGRPPPSADITTATQLVIQKRKACFIGTTPGSNAIRGRSVEQFDDGSVKTRNDPWWARSWIAPQRYERSLFRPENLVTGVTEAGNDVTHFVEVAVDCRGPEANVGMGSSQCRDAFGRSDEHERANVAAAAALQQRDGRVHRTRGGEHRVDDERGALVEVVDEFLEVVFRLQGLVIAAQADDADLGIRNHVEHAVEHAEAGAQDRNDRNFAAADLVDLDRPAPAFDRCLLEREIGGGFVRQQARELVGQLAEFLRRDALLAQQSDLVLDQRMWDVDDRHAASVARSLQRPRHHPGPTQEPLSRQTPSVRTELVEVPAQIGPGLPSTGSGRSEMQAQPERELEDRPHGFGHKPATRCGASVSPRGRGNNLLFRPRVDRAQVDHEVVDLLVGELGAPRRHELRAAHRLATLADDEAEVGVVLVAHAQVGRARVVQPRGAAVAVGVEAVAGDAVVRVHQAPPKDASVAAVARQQGALRARIGGVRCSLARERQQRTGECERCSAHATKRVDRHLLTSTIIFMSGCTAHSISTVPGLSKTTVFDSPTPYEPRSKLFASESEKMLCENGSSLTNFTESPSLTLSFLTEKALPFCATTCSAPNADTAKASSARVTADRN